MGIAAAFLLGMMAQTPAPLVRKADFHNWRVAEVPTMLGRACTFALSPHFHGIVFHYRPSTPHMEVVIEPLGVTVLPDHIPLKIEVNGQREMAMGLREGGRITFSVPVDTIGKAMAKRGMVRVFLSDPSIRDVLLARYRMEGGSYSNAFAAFETCQRGLQPVIASK